MTNIEANKNCKQWTMRYRFFICCCNDIHYSWVENVCFYHRIYVNKSDYYYYYYFLHISDTSKFCRELRDNPPSPSDYLRLSWTILDYLGLSRTILDYLGLSWTISGYLRLSQTILNHARLSRSISN